MKLKQTLITFLLVSLSLNLLAHGKEEHGKEKNLMPASPAIQEQKPWGIAGDAKAVTRTIAIGMGDNMRFTPDRIAVKLGETVQFTIQNNGKILHEFVIGTQKELADHAAMMVKFPTMEHDEPYMAHVAAGKSGRIVWQFNQAGEFDFACLIAGHYSAGMVGKITVVGADMTAGEVRKIDKETGKITLRHEAINNLDMPSMTMVFLVSSTALLDQVQTGDKVKFTAERQQGKFVVTKIQTDQTTQTTQGAK